MTTYISKKSRENIEKRTHKFIDKLCDVKSSNTFNPYVDMCDEKDTEDSTSMRRKLLFLLVKKACYAHEKDLWVARDLGYNGGRRTGLAMTDDKLLIKYLKTWNLKYPYDKPICKDYVSERTATVVQSIIRKVDRKVFLWNVYPFHPYSKGKQFSNRKHTKVERDIGIDILKDLIDMIEPKRVIAIGNDARDAIKDMENINDFHHVRHPSYGGMNIFIKSMVEIYNIVENENQVKLF